MGTRLAVTTAQSGVAVNSQGTEPSDSPRFPASILAQERTDQGFLAVQLERETKKPESGGGKFALH